MNITRLKTKLLLGLGALFLVLLYGQFMEERFTRQADLELRHITQLIVPLSNDLHELSRAFDQQVEAYRRAFFASDDEDLTIAAIKSDRVQRTLEKIHQRLEGFTSIPQNRVQAIKKAHLDYSMNANAIYTPYVLGLIDEFPENDIYNVGQMHKSLQDSIEALHSDAKALFRLTISHLENTITERRTFVLTTIAFRVAFIISLLAASYYLIFKRLQTLIDLCQALSINLNQKVPNLGKDELGELAHSIEQLRKNHLQRQEELESQLNTSESKMKLLEGQQKIWIQKLSLYLSPDLYKSIFGKEEEKP
jgi:methyl-accepting chemotaxis protein